MDTKLKRKKIADIIDKNYNQKWERDNELKKMKKSIFYRGGPTRKSDLIKPMDSRHQKILREEEEALGITALS